MNVKDFDNPMLKEIRSTIANYNGFNKTQSFDYYKSVVPMEELKAYENVVLTGCGDSYCSAVAAKPVFEGASAEGIETEALRNIEFTRYYNTYKGWDDASDKYLVGAVSISGGPVRPREALARINNLGGASVAFTNNPASEFAKVAKYVIDLHIVPSEDDVPLVRPYEGSTFSLMMFGLYMNVAQGKMTLEEAEAQRAAAMEYVNSFDGEVLDTIEEQALALSEKWEALGVDQMDFVGDGADWATAFYGSAKMVESFGGLTTNDDSEDWCHINYFNRTPEKVGTFVVANENSGSFGRCLETIRVMNAIGRPTAVITDADDLSVFPEGVDVFKLPKAKVAWANPLMQHLPMDFAAAFIGELKNVPPFRLDSAVHDIDRPAYRFKKSEMVIVD